MDAGNYYLGTTLAATALVLGWFLADSSELGVKTSPLLKTGVVALAIVAVPYYLLRYKGWRQSLKSFGIFSVFFVGYLVVLFAFEFVGTMS